MFRNRLKQSKLPFTRYYSELTITDPLIAYESNISRGLWKKDEAQHRAAIELQKLYFRVKDYKLPTSFRLEIRRLNELFEKEEQLEQKEHTKVWYTPSQESQELIKMLSDEEELYNFNSPQGLLLHGEVGCGKSMLMDMFSDCLPHVSKKRWHYSAFMLNVYEKIHKISQAQVGKRKLGHEVMLLEIAEELIDNSTILLLDEFMLPDMAAAKIMKSLLVYYFKLGGVLVATSNRLPKDLYSQGFQRQQFSTFFNILQHRCVSYDMRSTNDYRTILSDGEMPYYLPEKASMNRLLQDVPSAKSGIPATIYVYGHPFEIPWQTDDGIAKFNFEDLCAKTLASADYISLTSRYHTILIDNVPVLTLRKKNEARRFITFLDAAYESRCRIAVRSSVPLDTLFFPDMKKTQMENQDDRIPSDPDQETFGKATQDLEAPYRPNVSLYTGTMAVDSSTRTQKPAGDYSRETAFTGEDEKFAYKRAVSRLREMTSFSWWESANWTPVTRRPWESLTKDEDSSVTQSQNSMAAETSRSNAPKFQPQHFWAMGQWNPRPNSKKIDERTRKWMKGVGA